MIPELFLKDGVIINGAHFYPEMVRITNIARSTAPKTTDGAVWITSGADKAKGRVPNSKHYENHAFDFRISNVVGGHAVARSWAAKMALALGPDYDVVLEADHIHCEFDPETNQEAV